jgi:hypothetical protein
MKRLGWMVLVSIALCPAATQAGGWGFHFHHVPGHHHHHHYAPPPCYGPYGGYGGHYYAPPAPCYHHHHWHGLPRASFWFGF